MTQQINTALLVARILMSLLFIMAGIGYKISAVPFHFWTPDVYEGSPTPVAATRPHGCPQRLTVTLVHDVLRPSMIHHFGELDPGRGRGRRSSRRSRSATPTTGLWDSDWATGGLV